MILKPNNLCIGRWQLFWNYSLRWGYHSYMNSSWSRFVHWDFSVGPVTLRHLAPRIK